MGGATESLLRFIDADELPVEYGEGKGSIRLGQHPHELRLCAKVTAVMDKLQQPERALTRCVSDGHGMATTATVSTGDLVSLNKNLRRTSSTPDFNAAPHDDGRKKGWSFERMFRPRPLQIAHLGDENKFTYDRLKGIAFRKRCLSMSMFLSLLSAPK